MVLPGQASLPRIRFLPYYLLARSSGLLLRLPRDCIPNRRRRAEFSLLLPLIYPLSIYSTTSYYTPITILSLSNHYQITIKSLSNPLSNPLSRQGVCRAKPMLNKDKARLYWGKFRRCKRKNPQHERELITKSRRWRHHAASIARSNRTVTFREDWR